MFDGGSVREVDVAEGDVERWGGEAGAGAGDEGRNAKEACLEEVGGGDERSMVRMRLKGENSGEGWWLGEELVLGDEF